MAFDAGKVGNQKKNEVVVEVNMIVEGQEKTLRYALRQISRGEMVRLIAEARKSGREEFGMALIGRVFESGDELGGGMSVYDLIDAMDEEHQDSFIEHVSKVATASKAQLAALGVAQA